MPAVTDLTFTQLNTALNQILGTTANNYIELTNDETGNLVRLNLTALAQADSLNDEGVIKVFSILLEAARKAQETANTGKTTGEKLSAFPAPTNGAPANNFVPVTRTMTARHDLTSATKIVGTNV